MNLLPLFMILALLFPAALVAIRTPDKRKSLYFTLFACVSFGIIVFVFFAALMQLS